MPRLLALSLLFLTACATNFTGEAKVPHGVAGCRSKCEEWGLEFAGMVAMGEYTDGCVCNEKGKQLSMHGVGGAFAGGVGVVLQMRAAQQRNAAMMR